MLRKVRQQVSQALNATRHEILNNEEDSFEGLLCPLCMRAFLTPKELQEHFDTHNTQQEHVEEASPSSSRSVASSVAAPDDGYVNDGLSMNTEMEIRDLKNIISDEKRYSYELKKELDRLHSVIANQASMPQGEVPYLVQQIQALEAGKSMVTQRMLEMEKSLSAVNRMNEHLKEQKVEIAEKVDELTSKVTQLTEEIEEKQSEKAVLRDELLRFKSENENCATEVERLERQLEQRPSEDDIRVLRQELVRSQQLMDNVTQERESEIAEHLATIEGLKHDQEQLEERLAVKNAELERSYEENRKNIAEQQTEHLEPLQKETENITVKYSEAGKRILELEHLLKESHKGVEGSDAAVESLKQRLAETEAKLSETSEEKNRQETELRILTEEKQLVIEERKTLSDRIAGIKAAGTSKQAELEEEILRLAKQLEDQQKRSEEKDDVLRHNTQLLSEANTELESRARQLEEKSAMLNQQTTENVAIKQNLQAANEKIHSLSAEIATNKENYEEDIKKLKEAKVTVAAEHKKMVASISAQLKTAVSEKQELVSEKGRLHNALEEERRRNAEKDMMVGDGKLALEVAEEKATQLLAQLEHEAEAVNEIVNERDALREKLAAAETNTNSLMEKMAEGEGGMKLAMEQMQDEKQKLGDSIRSLKNQIKSVKEDKDRILEAKEKEWHIKHSKQKDSVKKLEASLNDLKRTYSACEEDCRVKSDRLLALEKEYFEETERMRIISGEKDATIEELGTNCSKLSAALSEKESALAEKLDTIAKDHDRIEKAVRQLSAAEEKARLLEEALNKAKSMEENFANESRRLESEIVSLNEKLSKEREEANVERNVLEKTLFELEMEKDKQQKEMHEENSRMAAQLLAAEEDAKKNSEIVDNERENLLQRISLLENEIEVKVNESNDRRVESETLQSSMKSKIENLEKGNQEMEVELGKKEEAWQMSAAEREELQKRVEEMKSTISKQTKKRKMEENAYNQEIKLLKDEHANLQQLHGQTQQRSEALSKEVDRVSELLGSTAAKLADKEGALQEKQRELETLKKVNDNLTAKTEKLQLEKDSLARESTCHREEIAKMKQTEGELEENVTSLKRDVLTSEAVIQDMKSKAEVESKENSSLIDDLKHKISTLEEAERDWQYKCSESTEALKTKHEEILNLTSNLESLKQHSDSIETQLQQTNEHIQVLEEDLGGKCRIIEELETAKTELEKQHSLEAEKFTKSSAAWLNQETLLREEIVGLQKDFDNAEKNHSLFASQSVERENGLHDEVKKLKKELNSAQTSVSKLRAELTSAEECAVFMKKDFENQLSAANALIERSKEESHKKEGRLTEELREKVQKIQDTSISLEMCEIRLKESDSLVSELRDELQAAVKSREEAEEKLTLWTDEKRTLLERCLNTESDLDFERERNAENRRRFEEAVSAMHELGRANQTLQMDISKQFNRKWLDDTEAVCCQACQKAFSLTVRKHHCRVCGLIFCATCSSRTAQISSSKNPVRICNACHEELLNR